MAQTTPEIRWHYHSALERVDPKVETQFKDVQDYNLAPLSKDPSLLAAVRAHEPLLEAHAMSLFARHMRKRHAYDESCGVDILIRLVISDWGGRLPEVKGVHGGYVAYHRPVIMLLCAVPELERVTACVTHELSHHLKYVNSGTYSGLFLADWLLDEVMAEQLVLDYHGTSALTHNRTCPPATKQTVHSLLQAETQGNDVNDAIDTLLNTYQSGKDCYALANELVRLQRWSYKDLQQMNDQQFGKELLRHANLWMTLAELGEV